jgi:hypothetical protein
MEIRKDHILHFGIAFAVAFIIMQLPALLLYPGVGLLILACIGWEMHGEFEVMDLIADATGIAIAVIIGMGM